MRTKLELLKFALSNLENDKYSPVGLCNLFGMLLRAGELYLDERYELLTIIYKHPPESVNANWTYFLKNGIYYFKPGELTPRIEYLKELIKIYEKKK